MPLSHCHTWIQWAYSVQLGARLLIGGLSRVGISSRSTRPWNGQPPSNILKVYHLENLGKYFFLAKFIFPYLPHVNVEHRDFTQNHQLCV